MQILGTGMSAKMWEVTVEHARTCVLDTTRNLYFPAHSQQTGVVFNAVGQVTGLISEGEYADVDKLSETEKAIILWSPITCLLSFISHFSLELTNLIFHHQADAQNSVISALNQGDFASFEDEASLIDRSSHLTNALYSPSSPRTEGSSANKLLGPQKPGGFDYTPASASSPDIMSSIYSVAGTSGLDDYGLSSFDSMSLRYDQALGFPVSNSLICDTDSMAHVFSDEDHLQFFDTDLQSQFHIQADFQSAVDSFMVARTTTVANGKAQRRWRKLFNVLKWFMVRKRPNQRYR